MRTIDSPLKALAILFPVISFPPVSMLIGGVYAAIGISLLAIVLFIMYVRRLSALQKNSFFFSVLLMLLGCAYMLGRINDGFLSILFILYIIVISVALFSSESAAAK
jgi:O-antigen/teichoic acid export membrane protein